MSKEKDTQLPTAIPEGEAKLDKQTVNYKLGQDDSICANCTNFLAPNNCVKVDGLINPQATCDLFVPSQQANPDASGMISQLLGGPNV